MNYTLGSYYPNKEEAKLEFKEYCFKVAPSLEFSKEKILDYIKGEWDDDLDDFNNQNMRTYFNYYIPKYISCFSNSKIDGKLIIGIDDDEEITGIPSNGLDLETLEKYTDKSINNYIRCSDGDYDLSRDEIKKCINVKLIEVENNSEYLTNEIDSLLESYNNDLKKYKNKMKKYKEVRKLWRKQIDKYSAKLVVYLNDKELRNEFCQFIENLHEDSKLGHIIDLLKSDKYIEFPDDIDVFLEQKKDELNVFYWIVIFKDIQIEKLSKNRKPLKPRFECNIDPEMILMKLSYLRMQLFNKIKYYIIEISFNCSGIKNPVYFKFPNKKKWIMRSRIGKVNDCGPGCI